MIKPNFDVISFITNNSICNWGRDVSMKCFFLFEICLFDAMYVNFRCLVVSRKKKLDAFGNYQMEKKLTSVKVFFVVVQSLTHLI